MLFQSPLIDTLFRDLNGSLYNTGWSQRSSLETADNGDVLLTIEVPGRRPEDIEVSVENKVLSLKVKDKPLRSYDLSDAIDIDNIIAKTEYGVLTVTLPKKEKAIRKIPVLSGSGVKALE